MRRQLLPALRMLFALTVICGLAYPLLVTGVAQAAFRHQAEGSLVEVDGRPVGSALVGQAFTRPEYFHPRPSAAGEGYDATASGASNLGPTNPELLAAVSQRVGAYRDENGLAVDPESHLTRAEQPQLRGRLEEAEGERRNRLVDVLAVVEDHDRGAGS